MRKAFRPAIGAIAALGVAVGVAACGGGSSSAPGSSAAGAKVPAFARNFSPPASGCGSFTAKAPVDNVHKRALGGYTDFPNSTIKLLKSAWASWKPSHPGPYTIAISWAQLVSDFQVQVVDEMKKQFQADKNVKQLIVRTTGSNLDVAQQLRQYEALVQQKPDIIVLESPSPDSFNGPVQKAKAAGIPTVTLLTPVPVDGAVNVDGNNYLGAATTVSYVTKLLRGKGNLLAVRALPGPAVDSQAFAGWKAAVANCPGMKIVGQVFGGFSEAGAKSETLKYLATHPQKVDAAAVLAGMGTGTMKAFQQTGRPIPALAEIGLDKGLLGYWRQNQAKYHAASTSLPPVPAADAIHEVVMRMLAGQGVRLNTLVGELPIVNDSNLSQWSEPDWNLNTPGGASGTRSSFLPSAFLSGFFSKPAPLK
jgi:ribose transport system substrate-binding protein